MKRRRKENCPFKPPDVAVGLKELLPEGQPVDGLVEAELGLDNGADAHVGAKVGVKVGGIALLDLALERGRQDHDPARLLYRKVGQVSARDNVLAVLLQVLLPILHGRHVEEASVVRT